MNTDSMHVDNDAAFRGIESRYHKKRSRRKAKTLCSSMADDCATTEDEEEGIIVTDDDVISPRKSTAQMITLVGTDGAAPRPAKGLSVPSANILRNPLIEAMVARPYHRRTMTFQSFHMPAKPRGDVGTRSAKADEKLHPLREVPRRNRNTLRKLPLYRMKNDLKRKLHKLERRLSRIKRDEELEKIVSAKQQQLEKPSPPQIKTPTQISGLISQAIEKTSRSAGVRSIGGSAPSRRIYSSREMIQKISESTQNLQKLELELSARKDEQRNKAARSVSSTRSSPKSALETSPLHQYESADNVKTRQQAEGESGESPGSKIKSKPRSIRSRQKQTKQTVKPAKKKLLVRQPKKHKANLRGFKQEIPIEGMNYKMEMVLDASIIARTRTGNIDFRKDPKFVIKTTKTTDLRDEFSSYCGNRMFVKNWLFQV